jgi:hypothetical protein
MRQGWHRYTFFYGTGDADDHLKTGFLIHKGIISAAKKIELLSDSMCIVTE